MWLREALTEINPSLALPDHWRKPHKAPPGPQHFFYQKLSHALSPGGAPTGNSWLATDPGEGSRDLTKLLTRWLRIFFSCGGDQERMGNLNFFLICLEVVPRRENQLESLFFFISYLRAQELREHQIGDFKPDIYFIISTHQANIFFKTTTRKLATSTNAQPSLNFLGAELNSSSRLHNYKSKKFNLQKSLLSHWFPDP